MRGFIWRLLPGLGVVCAAAAVVVPSVLALPAHAAVPAGPEEIASYDVAIAIQRDASILVTEQIAYDFGTDDRHGIIREIPVLRAYNDRYDRYYPAEVRSVQSPDAPDQYTVDNTGGTVVIKVGDPGQTVTGVHDYQFVYLIRDSMDAYADHDELYWDAIGDRWDVPIMQAAVRITAPAAPVAAACWAGPHGSASKCQRAAITDAEATFSQAGLGPHEALTVAVSLPKGVIAPPRPLLRERWSLQRAFALTPASAGASGGLLAILVMLGALMLLRDRRRHAASAPGLTSAAKASLTGPLPLPGHDRPPMETSPPEGLRPAEAGALLYGVVGPRGVTATIVDLAVRGYLRIADTEQGAASRDRRLVRLDKADGLLHYEQVLLDGLFMHPTMDSGFVPLVRLSALGSDFTAEVKRAQDALYTDMIARGWFTARPDRTRRTWLLIGSAMLAAGVIAVIITAASSHFALVPVPLALAGLVLTGRARRMLARTAAGTAMARRVAGFRRYITTAAAAQAYPAGQSGTPYDYLPYAIAFGCTSQWADLAGELARASQAPSWYQGSAPFNRGSLTALTRTSYYFSSVHHFAVTANSGGASGGSGSGGSTFSGGGYSGGGGGGGGGGSW